MSKSIEDTLFFICGELERRNRILEKHYERQEQILKEFLEYIKER